MTEHEQRIAIAKWCGWSKGRFAEGDAAWFNPDGKLEMSGQMPDFVHDLNAMHEAEERLSEEVPYYNQALCKLGVTPASLFPPANKQIWGYVWHATAAQRAEALLRTVGLWTDAP